MMRIYHAEQQAVCGCASLMHVQSLDETEGIHADPAGNKSRRD